MGLRYEIDRARAHDALGSACSSCSCDALRDAEFAIAASKAGIREETRPAGNRAGSVVLWVDVVCLLGTGSAVCRLSVDV